MRTRCCPCCGLSFRGDEPVCPSCRRHEYRDGTPWGFEGCNKERAKRCQETALEREQWGQYLWEPTGTLQRLPETAKVQLKRFAAEVGIAVSAELLDPSARWSAERALDNTVHALRLQIRGFIWAEQERVRRIEIRTPETWWQHFKERFFRGWMRRRWPVRYTVHVVDVEAIYPEFKQAMPRDRAGLAVLLLDPKGSTVWTEPRQ